MRKAAPKLKRADAFSNKFCRSDDLSNDRIHIRIISARRPTRLEARQYREGTEP
jgi:uncharacterized DUF497 family protein